MRLGLSNKITQPYLRGSAPVAEVARYSLTLYAQADSEITGANFGTFSRKNTDGNYYGVEFPNSWIDLNTSSGVVTGTDPFSAYRVIAQGDANHTKNGRGVEGGSDFYALSIIDAHLDVTIVIDATVSLGANAVAGLGAVNPALLCDISDNVSGLDPLDEGGTASDGGGRWNTRFSEDAAKNLTVRVENSGNVHGGGGWGGDGGYYNGISPSNCAGEEDITGGGGGGGAGLHPSPATPTHGVAASARLPGQEGVEFPAGPRGDTIGDNNTAEDGVEGGLIFGGAKGAGGTADDDAQWPTNTPGGTPGKGGVAIANYNRGLYQLDTSGFATTPVYTIVNEDDAYVYGGGGGGGGGLLSSGGNGGGKISAVAVGGQSGLIAPYGGSAGAVGGEVFAGGTTASANWLGVVNGGSATVENNHSSGNTQVTVQGSDRAW